ncbi:dihydrofolate reductase [Puteibacter caeruleilacunae]|nr:dihydrofolate reductase [Puteibacter caeruleilacunae]
MKKILVTYQVPREGLAQLEEDFEIIYPEQEAMTKDEIIAKIGDVDGLLSVFIKSVDKDIIEAGKNLKIIANFGVGYNNIDIDCATAKGIVVTNTPNAVCEPTADMALGLMLAVMRRIAVCDRKLRVPDGLEWGLMKNLGNSPWGKTLGIIGMGKIGKALARRAKACGMKIVYHNRRRMSAQIEAEFDAQYLSMDELLQQADVVSLNCPLTPETTHLISGPQFEMMKDGAYIINTARGPVIDEKALVKYLQNGKLAGAGLDVFEEEPVITKALLEMDQVVMTPHTGTGTIETRIETAREAADNIIGFFKGDENISKVN